LVLGSQNSLHSQVSHQDSTKITTRRHRLPHLRQPLPRRASPRAWLFSPG
jgi:hypothetical protein